MSLKDRLYDVPVVGTAVRLQDRYEDDAADQFAAAIGFFGFLSLFPLLVLVIAVAAATVAADPASQRELARTIQETIPGFGALLGGDGSDTQIAAAIDSIVRNAPSIGLVSLLVLLPTALKVVRSAMEATNHVFHVDVGASGVRTRLRMVGALVLLGGLALAGAVASSAVGASGALEVSSLAAGLLSAGGMVLTLVLDVLLFLVAYRILAAAEGPAWRRLWPGALLAGTGWTVLKIFGATYVSGQISRANELYGALGGVVGLLLLLYLAGRLYLYGAELSALLYAPGAEMAARADDVVYEGEDPRVLPDGPLRARPGTEDGLAAPRAEARPAPPSEPEPARPVPSPVSAATATRLADLDEAREAQEREAGTDVRGAVAALLGIGALGALVRWMRPWEAEDEG